MQNNETMANQHLSTQDDEDDCLVPSPRGSRQKHEQPRAKGVRGHAKKHLCVKREKKQTVSSWAEDQIAVSIRLLLQPSDGEWMD